MASEEAIRNLMALTESIFKSHAIVQDNVRYKWCKMAIESGRLFDATDAKFDVQSLAKLTSKSDTMDQFQKNTYHLGVAVENKHLNIMQAFNPHLRIVNGSNPSHPHAVAQAQRQLDTRVMIREIVCGGSRSYLDIGGNYTTHPTLDITKGIEIHCCTLREGFGEWHRQTQRDVAVRNGMESTLVCRGGVQNCTYTAEIGMCVHVLPMIDPDTWPEIFRKHGLRRVESIHHHPADLDSHERKGFMPYPNMHWTREADDMIQFHFDNDSSLGYRHRFDWMMEYSHSWMRSEPTSEYVIYYEVKRLEHGMLYSSLLRLKKSTVHGQPSADKLLFVGGDEDIMVPVAKFNPASGCAISDPSGYETVYYPVPERMYNWAFFNGISNDTSNPGKSYTRNDMRQALRAINRDRELNAFAFTEQFALDQTSIESIADGIYIAVVMAAAQNKMILGKMTAQMQRMQRRWGHQNVVSLLTRTVTLTTLLPYFLLAGEMQDVVDVLRLAVARGVQTHAFLSTPMRRCPYKVIGRMEVPSSIERGIPELPRHDPAPPEELDVREYRMQYYRTFKDHLNDEQRQMMEAELFPDGNVDMTSTIPTMDPVFAEDDGDIEETLPTRSETWKAIVDNREEWLRRFNALRDGAAEELFLDLEKKVPQVGNDQDVHVNDANALLEFALHCFDLHQSTKNNALENLSRHWKGTGPNTRTLADDQDKEIGAMFYQVDDDGYILGIPDGVFYDQVMDPYTRNFLDVVRKRDGRMNCGVTKGNIVYTLDTLRISNSKRLGLVAMRQYEKGVNLSAVKFHLIDGIAGSGKTRELTHTMEVTDIFATAPRASAESVRNWCKSQDRFAGKEQLIDKQFRTCDSHNLGKVARQGKRLFIDEAFMVHDGAVVLLAVRAGVSEVFMSGDNAQIGMIDRGAGYGDLLFSKRMHFHSIKYLNETERCPGDATVLLRSLYPEWRRPLIRTKNPIRRSININVHPNVEHPVYKTAAPTATYLTFTQNDKDLTAKGTNFVDAKKVQNSGLESPIRPVITVHESQGETYANVVVHRLNKYSNSTFASLPHQYVAFSRHTMMFTLNTVCGPSMCPFTKLMQKGQYASEAEIDSVMSNDVPARVLERTEATRKVLQKYVNLG